MFSGTEISLKSTDFFFYIKEKISIQKITFIHLILILLNNQRQHEKLPVAFVLLNLVSLNYYLDNVFCCFILKLQSKSIVNVV